MKSRFISGPSGASKTTYGIDYVRSLLQADVLSENILVLVPHRVLGIPYQTQFAQLDWPGSASIDVVTLGGLARRGLELYWPQIAEAAGFENPHQEPSFLTIETSQYFMADLVQQAVQEGLFDSLSMTIPNIMRQTLDNLAKAAVNGFPHAEVAERLTTAWGGRHSSRPLVYRAVQDVIERYRSQCLVHNQLDFSLQIELYMRYLLGDPLYARKFKTSYSHLIADNLEEQYPVTGDFIRWLWPSLDSALLLFDTDAGYRIFLGADPDGLYRLSDLCDEIEHWPAPQHRDNPHIESLAVTLGDMIAPELSSSDDQSLEDFHPESAINIVMHQFYPQMIDWTVTKIAQLIENDVPPGEIVVLAPMLGESLRFALVSRLADIGIRAVSHRPSRALRDEPAARTVLTFMALAYPAWGYRPPLSDVATALGHAIEGLDPLRSRLLAQVVYGTGRAEIGSFDPISPDMQARITFGAGEKYEHLRRWLLSFQSEADAVPPDHFFHRLFGELLSQPGFGFHSDLEAGRVIAELSESARKFRQTLYPDGVEDWIGVTHDYFNLVQEGLLAATFVSSWRAEQENAVFLAPAYTFLMRNRSADYQFWLDVGSHLWWERIEQPLTHPYVLQRDYPPHREWTDSDEHLKRRESLRHLVMGLTRRCRGQIFAAVANVGEQGYEQRGPLLQVFQQLIQRYGGIIE